jgi:hypothetical protein
VKSEKQSKYINELILYMEKAKNIHQEWANYQEYLQKNNKKIILKVGNVKWHKKWVKIYDDVIIALKKNNKTKNIKNEK